MFAHSLRKSGKLYQILASTFVKKVARPYSLGSTTFRVYCNAVQTIRQVFALWVWNISFFVDRWEKTFSKFILNQVRRYRLYWINQNRDQDSWKVQIMCYFRSYSIFFQNCSTNPSCNSCSQLPIQISISVLFCRTQKPSSPSQSPDWIIFFQFHHIKAALLANKKSEN